MRTAPCVLHARLKLNGIVNHCIHTDSIVFVIGRALGGLRLGLHLYGLGISELCNKMFRNQHVVQKSRGLHALAAHRLCHSRIVCAWVGNGQPPVPSGVVQPATIQARAEQSAKHPEIATELWSQG